LMGCVFNSGVDVFAFEERIVGKNLVEARAVCKEFKHVGYAKTLATNARTASPLAFFNGDSLESVVAHIRN